MVNSLDESETKSKTSPDEVQTEDVVRGQEDRGLEVREDLPWREAHVRYCPPGGQYGPACPYSSLRGVPGYPARVPCPGTLYLGLPTSVLRVPSVLGPPVLGLRIPDPPPSPEPNN